MPSVCISDDHEDCIATFTLSIYMAAPTLPSVFNVASSVSPVHFTERSLPSVTPRLAMKQLHTSAKGRTVLGSER